MCSFWGGRQLAKVSTRARAWIGQAHEARKIAERVYDEKFLASLGKKCAFDALDAHRAQELRRIAANYIRIRLGDDDYAGLKKSEKSYRSLLALTDRFLKTLGDSYRSPDFYNIATEMHICALGRREPLPQKDFPKLTEHQRNLEAHYRELIRLTELLKATLHAGIERSKTKRGPKRDPATQYLVTMAAEFWSHWLKRKFTIDYHKGSGHSRAYDFVLLLFGPLEDIAPTSLVTAMRAEIATRHKQIPGLRKSR